MKKYLTGLAFLPFIACSSFCKIADATQMEQDENGYTKVYNKPANFESLTYYDFKFATDPKQFKNLNVSKPKFKDILFYAKTVDDPYEYYVLYNPKRLNKADDYRFKDTLIGNARFVLAISKNAPSQDAKFIMDRMSRFE